MSSLAEVSVAVETAEEMKARIDARNELVMEHQGLVHRIAHGFRACGLSHDDLAQFGNIGLIRAAEKFDPGRGLRFSTYACYWIRQAIYNGITATGHPVRVPRLARAEARAVNRRIKAVAAETGTTPSMGSVIAAMIADGTFARGKDVDRLVCAAAADAMGPGPETLEELIIVEPFSDSPIATCIEAEDREQLEFALALLPEAHRDVLTWRYGLDGSPPLESDATAALLGLSRPDADRLEDAAIRSLKKLLNR